MSLQCPSPHYSAKATQLLAQMLKQWILEAVHYSTTVRNRLQCCVTSGQSLGFKLSTFCTWGTYITCSIIEAITLCNYILPWLVKMLISVLSIKKHLVASFRTYFQNLSNHSELEKSETTKSFCWCRSTFQKQNWITPCSALIFKFFILQLRHYIITRNATASICCKGHCTQISGSLR